MPGPLTRKSSEIQVIYFAQGVGGGPIKIGIAQSVVKRLETMSQCSPVALVALASAPGRICDEANLHVIFDRYRLHGEWFLPNRRLGKLILAVKETGRLPPEYVRPDDVCKALTVKRLLRGQRKARGIERLSRFFVTAKAKQTRPI